MLIGLLGAWNPIVATDLGVQVQIRSISAKHDMAQTAVMVVVSDPNPE